MVTPDVSVWRNVDDPPKTAAALDREGIRRILTDHKWPCLSPDSLKCWNTGVGWLIGGICRKIASRLSIDRTIGWVNACVRACSALTPNDVDLILASGPPFSAFRLAARLSDKLGRPYVLDYRDPWTRKPHSRPPAGRAIQEEAELLAGAEAVTIVSPSWAWDLDQRSHLGPKLHIITNGYTSQELADVKPHHFGHFAIVYAGNFYPPKRVISPVLAALKRIKGTTSSEGGEWYFHYYGSQEDHVRKEAARLGVMERVVLHGSVPRTQALSALRGAGVAIVITSVFDEASLVDKGIMPGKLFEILGLGTPCLLIVPPGSDAETIVETTGGARALTGTDIDAIASFFRDVMSGTTPEPRSLEAYTWSSLAKNLDAILRGSG